MKNRKGSALLIVLGMMAFMIVSAVAFAAYMRFARLPSSYLRRSSSSRLLAKAALSRVIDELDRAVCSNPHPGVGAKYVAQSGSNGDWQEQSADQYKTLNVWKNRVYIGTNIVNFTQRDFADTVPVLSTEALAYIPPPLVNEARYYGRLSPAAQWHAMDFDAGRYAFCALDVSDFFDINRTLGSAPRSSASNQRVNIAHLFENPQHSSAGNSSQWDDFTADYDPTVNGKIPFTSMADFTLAYGSQSIGSLSNPVYSFLKGSSDALDNLDAQKAEYCRRMAFVTDSYFPPDEPEEGARFQEDYDLGDEENQPFALNDLAADNTKLQTPFMGDGSDGYTRLMSSVSRMGMCALWDYLDPDHKPLSLAIPTVERVPMVVGLETQLNNATVNVTRSPAQSDSVIDGVDQLINETDTTKTYERTVSYTLDMGASVVGTRINALLAYPFAHKNFTGDSKENSPFKLDGRFGFFFTVDGTDVKLRTSASSVLNFGNFKDVTDGKVTDDGVIVAAFLRNQQATTSSNITSEQDALLSVNGNLTSAAGTIASGLGQKPLLTVKYQWTTVMQTTATGMKNWVSEDGLKPEDKTHMTEARCNLPALKADGTVNSRYTSPATVLSILKGDSEEKFKLNAAVWLRVLDKNGDTVDMAPACMKDDDDLNNAQLFSGMMGAMATQYFGDTPYPLLKLSSSVTIPLNIDLLNQMSAQDLTLSPSVIMCPDPRFNHAPESWMALTGATLNESTWLNNCKASDRDGDIFLATSDAGYLQSIYELAHITRFTNLASAGATQQTGDMKQYNDGRTEIASSFGDVRNVDLMWRTYRPYANGDGSRDDFENCGFTSAGTGFKINPYSNMTNVIMAAFANTPLDWRAASTNDSSVVADLSIDQFNSKYAWNSYCSDSKFMWKDLEAVAGSFMRAMRGNQNTQQETRDNLNVFSQNVEDYWEDAYDSLDWNGTDEKNFCGVDLTGSSLWTADKKFLYGFWHDCFAAKQQLFLVFLRAEPSMLGGELAGATPPQLGSRAVALVWRDPKSGDSPYPHQTRVLFYKPLD